MNFTYQNFVRILTYQQKSNQGVIKLLMIIEFVQNIALCFPKHGWGQFQYTDNMLRGIQQLTNYTLFQHQFTANQLLDTFISCIALFYGLIIGLCLFKLKQLRLSQIVNLTLNIAIKIFKFPLITLYINYFYSYTFRPLWSTLTIISCAIFVLFTILTLYFQRDITINLSRKYYPLNSYYSPVLFIIYLIDFFRITIFVLLTTKTGFVFMLILNFVNSTLKLYTNINQQNDPDRFQQGLLLCYLALTSLLLIAWSFQINENNLFNLILYLTTLFFYLFQKISFSNTYNSSNLRHQIQQHIQNKLEYFFLKIVNNQDDTAYINYLRNILDMDIMQKDLSLSEENILLQYDYLIKNQSYYQALFLLNKFESQSLSLSLFYRAISTVFKSSIQSDIKMIVKQTSMIQTLNRDIILESEYQFKFKTILLKQINFFDRITQESKNIYELEKLIQVISQNIRATRNWLKRNNILEDDTNFTFIKIQMNFYYFVMQHNVKAMKLKKKLQLIQNKDQKTVEAIQLMKSKAIVLTLSLIKHKGIILNLNKASLQFLGFFSIDYKLEFIDQLLPEPIQPFHQLFLERYLKKNELTENYQQKQLEVLQQQENGNLQCLEVNFAISNDHTDFVLIALLKKIHQHKGYIIFDTTGKIISVNDQIQELDEIYQQMKTYNYIQYFTPDIFYILNNHEFQQEKEINFNLRAYVNRIDRQFRQFIQSQNKTITQVMPYAFEYMTSDRSEKFSLLHHKNNYSERDLLVFDIMDQVYQDKLMEIINSNISEKDRILKYKTVISKIVYDDQILQYQMELIFLEAKIDVEEENENLEDKLPKFKQVNATSCNDVSVVSSEQKASEILHEILQSKFKNSLFITVIFYQIIILLLVLIFLIIQIVQVQEDFTQKTTYFQYINVPTQLNKFFTNTFNYGFNSEIYQQIDSSQFMKNQFVKNKQRNLAEFRKLFSNLEYNLIQIEQQGYGFNFTIQMQQITLYSTQFSPLIELIKDNLIILLNYDIDSRQFAESILFFRLNLISAYNVSIKLSSTFNLLLQNYTTNLLIRWQYIISFYIALSFFPLALMIIKWHLLEKKHRTLIQIMTRLTQEQAFRQLEAKKAHISYIDDDRIRMTQSFHTHRSQIQVVSTNNNIIQHLRSKENQYLYELIKSKKINIIGKIIISCTFYLIITGLAYFGYLQISINDSAYTPVQSLMQTFTNFEISLNTLVSMSSIMKGQQIFINELSDIDSNIIGNVSNLFAEDEIPKYFSNLSLTYSKKIIKIFQSIILSEQIDEGQKNILYSLYKGDFCEFLSDELPFCDKTQTANHFSSEFGSYYDYDNNSDVLRIGIMGYVSRLSSLLKNNFNSEMSNSQYVQNITNDIFYTQDYNTLITQFSFNISHGFQLFQETVNSIAINLIESSKNNLVIYYATFSTIFIAVFGIVSIIQIKMAINRYQNLLLALVTLSEELLNDKTNLTLLKRLKT